MPEILWNMDARVNSLILEENALNLNCLGTVYIDHDECVRKNGQYFMPSYGFPSSVGSQYPSTSWMPQMKQYWPPVSSRPQYTSGGQSQCHDRHNRCTHWANMGECTRNEYWMKTHCQMSCNCCGCTLQSLLGIVYTKG